MCRSHATEVLSFASRISTSRPCRKISEDTAMEYMGKLDTIIYSEHNWDIGKWVGFSRDRDRSDIYIYNYIVMYICVCE